MFDEMRQDSMNYSSTQGSLYITRKDRWMQRDVSIQRSLLLFLGAKGNSQHVHAHHAAVNIVCARLPATGRFFVCPQRILENRYVAEGERSDVPPFTIHADNSACCLRTALNGCCTSDGGLNSWLQCASNREQTTKSALRDSCQQTVVFT